MGLPSRTLQPFLPIPTTLPASWTLDGQHDLQIFVNDRKRLFQTHLIRFLWKTTLSSKNPPSFRSVFPIPNFCKLDVCNYRNHPSNGEIIMKTDSLSKKTGFLRRLRGQWAEGGEVGGHIKRLSFSCIRHQSSFGRKSWLGRKESISREQREGLKNWGIWRSSFKGWLSVFPFSKFPTG